MEDRKNMGKRKSIKARAAAVILCAAAAVLSAGCGRDTYEVEYGVDGYVYVSKKLQSMEGVEDMRVVGDYLYYMQDSDSIASVSRVSVAELAAGEGRLDFSKAKVLFSFQTLTFDLPEGIGEDRESGEDGEGKEDSESEEGGEDRESGEDGEDKESGEDRETWEEVDFLSAMDGGYGTSKGVNLEKSYGRLILEEYAAAPDGTLYLYFSASAGGYFSQTPAGGVLCQQDPEGNQVYKVYVPEMLDFAVDSERRGMVLTEEGIRIMDGEGNQTGFVSTEEYHADCKISKEELFTDSEGRVYYTYVNENSTRARVTYEITGEGPFRLKDAGALLGEGFMNHSAAPGGDVYQFASSTESILYLYDRKAGSRRELLNWLESGLLSGGIRSVAGVTPEILIVNYSSTLYGGQSDIYQLTRTPVEELPERELLVVASPGGSFELQKAVMLFNAESSEYRVVLESYGAEYWDDEGWVCPRLDASLVSQNPPDMLNLGLLNTVKYARMDVLEDLSPYLEGSSIELEDIPENVIEGFTFDGRLVSIPATFYVSGIVMRAAQAEGLEGWAMEDLYRMTEQHPESMGGAVGNGYCRMGDGYEKRKESSWLLGELCARYYLDEFIDWAGGECRFDSDEFCDLIAWAGTYGWRPGHVEKPTVSTFWEPAYISEDILMVSKSEIEFTTLAMLKLQYGENVCLKGYPTADGKGYFPARTAGGLGICVNSSHKEAAWEFMELYRKICIEDAWLDIPASKKLIRELYEEETTPYYTEGKGGKPLMVAKYDMSVGDDRFPHYYVPQDQADAILDAIERADFTPMSDEEEMIVSIVVEEAESYYSGDKSIEEVAGLIQNRVQLVLNEIKP